MSKPPVEAIDVSKLTMKQLRELEQAAQERIEKLEEDNRRRAFEKMEKAASEVGMTPIELLKHFGATGRKPKKAAVTYANPENPEETWAGRGRKPAWVEAWLAAGKSLDELKVS